MDAASEIGWDSIDKVVYINLNKRKDRRVRLTRQLKAMGVPREKVVRVEAVDQKPGYLGCVKSHLLALKMARANGWKNVLILEDDMEFFQDAQNQARLKKFLIALQHTQWHVAFLAANYHNVTRLESVDYLVRVNLAWCACAYLVNSNYYDALIHNYLSSLNALQRGGEPQHYALDVNWHALMTRDIWLGIYPNAGYQAADRSDIEQGFVDYRPLFNKTIEEITRQTQNAYRPPFKVDFCFQWAPGWNNFESVLEAMLASPYFDCQVVLVPYFSNGAKKLDCSEQRNLLVAKGIPFVEYQNYSLLERQPHVVFLQNPYDEARPFSFSSVFLHHHGVQIAYIPYGLDMGDGERNRQYQYNLLCHNLARWVFVRSAHHREEYGRFCRAGNRHVYVTGHPKLDHYETRYGVKKTGNEVAKRKTLLWSPHFVMPDDEKMWSTFNLYTPTMMALMARDDINLIIRPHPLFRQFMELRTERQPGDQTQQNFQKLLKYSQNKNNVIWDFSPDYQSAFARSDALMADAGSFLLEYLPSHKPILYLTHENCLGINSSADFIYQAYPVARDEKAIHQFVDNVVKDIDPYREKRLQALQDALYLPEHGAGQEIANIIQRTLLGFSGRKHDG